MSEYLGFKKLKQKLAESGAKNPAGAAAAIGRNKYGKEKFQKAASEHKSMKHMQPKKK